MDGTTTTKEGAVTDKEIWAMSDRAHDREEDAVELLDECGRLLAGLRALGTSAPLETRAKLAKLLEAQAGLAWFGFYEADEARKRTEEMKEELEDEKVKAGVLS